MRKVGIIGGMSWESTVTYYTEMNQYVNKKLGGNHSIECLLYNVQYQEIKDIHKSGNWKQAGILLGKAGSALKAGGAEILILATNTMHIVAPQIMEISGLPLLHIANVTAEKLINDGIDSVGLVGTRFTMEQNFYKEILIEHGINVQIPDKYERNEIHRIINEELIHGFLIDSSLKFFVKVIENFQTIGLPAVILGCTEIGLLVKQDHCPITLYDTAILHAHAAADWALAE